MVTAWRSAWILDRRGLMETGGLPMSLMMGHSRSLMMGWMRCDVGGVDLVALWVKWFRRSGFCGFADLGFVCVVQ